MVGTREEWHKLMEGKLLLGKDECPFCRLEENKELILWRGKHWFIIQNKYPYTGTPEHIMAVPYNHHVFAYEFDKEIWSEMPEVHAWIRDFYKGKVYFSCARENDMEQRSIEHYHLHFMPGKLQGKYLRKMLQNQGFPIEAEPLE